MERNKNIYRASRFQNGNNTRAEYVHGSAARQLDVRIAIEEEPGKRMSQRTRQNRETALRMSLGYVLFLTLSMAFSAVVLAGYINLYAANTAGAARIAAMESKLHTMRLDNEETYNKIEGAVDLNEIKRIAIEDLGMRYAQEGQIVQIESIEDDYVRQYEKMPK